MAGDLKIWQGSDVPSAPNVKFERKGGWFVTKTQALLAVLLVALIIIAAILLTKHYTEGGFKNPESPELSTEKSLSYSSIENIHPISYELFLNHGRETVSGELMLVFSVKNNTDKIQLSYKGEKVYSPYLEDFNNTNQTYLNDFSENIASQMDIESLSFDKENSIVTIIASKPLEPMKRYDLKLTFLGRTNPEEKGVFVIPYKFPVNESTHEDRWIIGASLAPDYCSRVFPCVNGSSDPSTFRIKILRPRKSATVSNIFKKATRELPEYPGFLLDDYVWTPSVPVYSISYYVLPEYKARTYTGQNPLIVWYPPHLENTTIQIKEIANSLMKFYNDFFNIPLPIERLSLVVVDGIVSDKPGSMGIIPISSDLLYTNKYQTFKNEEKLFYYLGRKLCNLWLGNLVTFKSWNHYWLEDGFALFMADLAASQKFMKYDVSTFVTNVQQKSLHEDKFYHSLPQNLMSDIEEVKNNKTPEKGAFIFHMVSDQMTPSLFKKGIQMFFQKWLHNSVTPLDMWTSLNSSRNDIDIYKFVESWSKDGYPVLSVDYKTDEIHLNQAPVKGNASDLWLIPITFTSEKKMESHMSQIKKKLEVKDSRIHYPMNDSWIILNPFASGYFRTNYSESLWSKVAEVVFNDSSLSSAKAQLLDDAFSLASYQNLSYDVPLNLSLYVRKETQITPWLTFIKHINRIGIFMTGNQMDHDHFKVYLENQTMNIMTYLGFESGRSEKPIHKYMRGKIMDLSCRYDLHNGCNEWAKEQFKSLENSTEGGLDNEKVGPELHEIVYCYGLKSLDGNTSVNLTLMSRERLYEPFQEFSLLRSSICSPNQDELIRILEQSLDVDDSFFSAKRAIVIWLTLRNVPSSSNTAFGFVKTHWSSILNKFKNQSEIISAVIEGATHALTQENELEDLQHLATECRDCPAIIKDILSYSVERVTFNVDWRKKSLPVVRKWLMKNNNP